MALKYSRLASPVSSSCWALKRNSSKRLLSSFIMRLNRVDNKFIDCTRRANSKVFGTFDLIKRLSPKAFAWYTTSSSGVKILRNKYALMAQAKKATTKKLKNSLRALSHNACSAYWLWLSTNKVPNCCQPLLTCPTPGCTLSPYTALNQAGAVFSNLSVNTRFTITSPFGSCSSIRL